MIIAVLANENMKAEFLSRQFPSDIEFIWADSLRSFGIIEADAYFDLDFEFDVDRITRLKKLLYRPVFINSVIDTCAAINAPFIRINAWPTMLKREILEVVVPLKELLPVTDDVLSKLNWQYKVVPDIPGMVTPRIVSSIINEAWFALSENVSTRDQIDTAMKLGTNYPYGPFEWMQRIGENKVIQLLTALQQTDSTYAVAPNLLNKTHK